MTIWRLHTKTAVGDMSTYCLENNVAAMGWCFCKIYTPEDEKLEECIKNITSFTDYWELAYNSESGMHSVRRLAEDIKPNDFIWMRSEGDYYLAKIPEDSKWQFSHEAREKDAANQRTNIFWHKVEFDSVPDTVKQAFQRGFTLQRINVNSEQTELECAELFRKITGEKISVNKDDFAELYKKLFSLKSPIDIEGGINSGSLVCGRAGAGNYYESSKLRLMYVGRDLNGWNKLEGENISELTQNLFSTGNVEEFLHYAAHDPQYRNPETNVLEYSINKSPFWQLCREIMNQSGELANWAERILWSNVYKITYDGVSISWNLMNETFDACVEILRQEIESFKPNHIIFVTGANHFLARDLGDSYESDSDSEAKFYPPKNVFDVISKGIYTDKTGRRIKVVTANRPELTAGKITEKARKIIEAFESLKA